tara:strand:- start:364 stop:762 length:399 start_codon:yes stop_codon:yes gene_type:complete
MDNNTEIFEGKTFQDLTRDIYENSRNKRVQIDLLIQEVHSLISGIDDVALIGPVIKELMDVSIKNDEHLVKLASVLQRLLTRSQGTSDDAFSLTDQEKEDLINTLQDAAHDVQKKSDKLENIRDKKTSFMDN